jgi:hypothetical protein
MELLIFCAKSDPTPTLPCLQGREHSRTTRRLADLAVAMRRLG